jgi:hypothetical protein
LPEGGTSCSISGAHKLTGNVSQSVASLALAGMRLGRQRRGTPDNETIVRKTSLTAPKIGFLKASRSLPCRPATQGYRLPTAGFNSTVTLKHTHPIYRSAAYPRFPRIASPKIGGFPSVPSRTSALPLHGSSSGAETFSPPGNLAVYGTDRRKIAELAASEPNLGKPLHKRLPYLQAEVVWAAREEMARTVEDVLARRTRAFCLIPQPQPRQRLWSPKF